MKRAPRQVEIQQVPLDIRASLGAIDEDARTVELIFSTGADVERYDWSTGEKYIERLSMDPKHVRLDRLNAGAPLLNSHSAYSLSDQMGVVVDDSASVDGKRGRASVRFSKRADVEPYYQDVRDKVIRNVSVGYRTYRYEETEGKGNALPVRLATSWEPYEVSLVSMPADVGAQVRGVKPVDTNPCVIVTRKQEKNMADLTNDADVAPDKPSEYLREDLPETQRQPQREERQTEEPNERDMGADAERVRANGIMDACVSVRLPLSFARKLIDGKYPLVDAQRMIFEEYKKIADPNGEPKIRSGPISIDGPDPFIHKRAGIENALLHRVNPTHFKLEDKGREYRGMSMLDIARVYLQARGVRTTDMARMELAGAALGLITVRGGSAYHTTSDFPYLLADVANKSLRAEYDAAPQTFEPIVRTGSVPDFRASNRVQIGDAPALKPVLEHGEFTRGTIEEGREQVSAATYGRVFAITRQALVNDDLDAFARVPTKFGRMAKNLESDLVWYQILKNANMGDGNALFSAAHGNYAGAGDIGVTSIGAAANAMLTQHGLDGTTLVSAPPQYLIVPPNKMTQAFQFISTALQATSMDNVNPWAGKLQVIVEPRLQTGITIGPNSATGSSYAWYLATDKTLVDIVELVYLDGQSGPVIESRVGFDIDGLEIKCRHDVGAKALDWRGIYKSDGSDNS
jgi:phage major head subunit gpT-like protein